MPISTDELEALLEGGRETQTLDVKDACAWNVDSFAKDILAMSNVQNGGSIVIGVKDGTFERHGITAPLRKTYNLDIMKDQMRSYADPYVDFFVDFPCDKDGREYVVIRVLPFEEQPVICRRDDSDVHLGVVYYRNRTGRVQSAAVSNSHDMRDIIMTATVKMMQSLSARGLGPVPYISAEERLEQKFEREREGL